jgi:hypothetical protein
MATPRPHHVEAANSYARRTGAGVFVQLHLPRTDALEQPLVRFKNRKSPKAEPVDVDGSVADAQDGIMLTVRADALPEGLWQVGVREAGADTFRRVQARLLSRRGQPIALLTGPRPATKMPPPRRKAPTPTSDHAAGARLQDWVHALRRKVKALR